MIINTEPNNEIKKLTDIIINSYNPDKIFLFGSYARNDNNENSDIDILVISDNEKQLPRYRRGLKTRVLLSAINSSKDILFYSNEEFNKSVEDKNSFVSSIMKTSRLLYARQ